MWLTVIIACVLFVAASVAILGFGYQQMEQDRREKAEAVLARAPLAREGYCPLCDAPLRRASTVEQVVYEVERRIDAELQDVVQLLGRPAPEGLRRLYRASA